jgi:hypothetical protein
LPWAALASTRALWRRAIPWEVRDMPSSSFPSKALGAPLLVVLLLAWPASSGAASGRACSASWAIVPSDNVGRQTNSLEALSAVSATDAWAVGYYVPGSITKPLIEHWDGTGFSIVAGAAITGRSMLQDVAAVSSNDVWAVGFVGYKVLIEHWDGTAWTRQATTVMGDLFGVGAISSTDVWAVGFNGTKPLTMHWDGISWKVVPVPGGLLLPQLFGVSGSTSDDVWAVGTSEDNHGVNLTLTLHWDGSTWTHVSSPNPPAPDSSNYLLSVDAATADDVWAAGWYVGNTRLGLVEHWDGTAWSVSTTPEPDASPGLEGIAESSGTVWAVGDYVPPGIGGHLQTLTEEWDGSAWSVVPSPDVGGTGKHNVLHGVDTLADGTTLAVGYFSPPSQALYQTLAEEICPA